MYVYTYVTFAMTATIGIRSEVMCDGMGSVDHSTITAHTRARHRFAGRWPLILSEKKDWGVREEYIKGM